ncbi:MAG: UDP-N-acetylglucosamine 2-epimerase (non-hydrolyzing) [Bacteroidetes bacterium HGW-Bacteroidetes-7]|jgi:UDP-N-acetylglucosamine 2-epimerase (non-hydrolysing)|nr:MAG: UDP-N-acetylglucosamine 2-epimerase (non-hydrolyzing) [Bacteroidetes bacterium HGW-Bacteroidetes-7]
MNNILIVFGTRPEAIKMAPLIIELQKYPEKFKVIVAVTAQHRQMLDQVLAIFKIKVNYDLNIMKPGQDLYDITSNVILGLKNILEEASPDIVLVHGDTTSSMAAAIASFYSHIPVGHVEAGLRTHDIDSPWPEEFNRQLTARIATLHFSPSKLSKENLISENIPTFKIHITGNTVIDSLNYILKTISETDEIKKNIRASLIKVGINEGILNKWERKERKLVLITGHRRENFGDGFIDICNAIKELALKHPNSDFLYPMHLNPNVRKAIQIVFKNKKEQQPNIIFTEPIEYLPFIYLMQESSIVLTDSGGVQEEAPCLGKPVLVMRNNTERPELLSNGTVILVGTDQKKIVEETSILLSKIVKSSAIEKTSPYGDGTACKKIAEILSNFFLIKKNN